MNAMPSNAKPSLSRPEFLALASKVALGFSGLLGIAGLLRYMAYQPDPSPQSVFDLGPAASYPPGSRTVVAGGQAIVLSTEAGYLALSLLCTHLGCQVQPAAGGFTCPCHGSRFTTDGAVVAGPAALPLRSLRLEQTAQGNLILYTL